MSLDLLHDRHLRDLLDLLDLLHALLHALPGRLFRVTSTRTCAFCWLDCWLGDDEGNGGWEEKTGGKVSREGMSGRVGPCGDFLSLSPLLPPRRSPSTATCSSRLASSPLRSSSTSRLPSPHPRLLPVRLAAPLSSFPSTPMVHWLTTNLPPSDGCPFAFDGLPPLSLPSLSPPPSPPPALQPSSYDHTRVPCHRGRFVPPHRSSHQRTSACAIN